MAELEKDLQEEVEVGMEDAEVSAEELLDEVLEEVEEIDADTVADDEVKEKKSLFGKKAKSKELEKIAELEDKVKRQMAEFENYRKRTEKEKQAMFETGAKSVIEKMLPVVDNFERGLGAMPQEDKESAFANGMEMIYKQLLTEFENIGVKAIEATGNEFDPALHNAVMQVASESLESGIVASELQKGYTYRDGVVRHSMVAVVE
ncbi:MAG: nucleotide exchange factor GrpE [Lachnospiraceae bacterium]